MSEGSEVKKEKGCGCGRRREKAKQAFQYVMLNGRMVKQRLTGSQK